MVAEVAAIFDKVAREYHKMMELYMKGTGGGPGADEYFHNWMECDNTCVVTYLSGQHSNIYLSMVKMWDRSYGYVFVNKDQLPGNVCIGETYSGRDDDEEDFVSSFSLGTTPRGQRSGMENEMEKNSNQTRNLAASRKESSKNQREILALLKGDMDTSTRANHEGIMNDIEQTQWLLLKSLP
jgi:hypothetical protein